MSSKDAFYVQCQLHRADGVKIVSWIPQSVALKGRTIRLKDDNGEWEEGWVVDETYQTRPAEERFAASQLYKKHRDGTDAHRDKHGNWIGPRR